MTRYLPVACAFLFVLVPGLAFQSWFGGGQAAALLDQRVASLPSIPHYLPNWDGEDFEIDDNQIKQANLAGYVARKYTHRDTGEVVAVLVVCGYRGPISVHTPDVCYQGSGYGMGEIVKKDLSLADSPISAHFNTALFQPQDATNPGKLRIHWAWSADGNWDAPEFNRGAYLFQPVLYKMYVIQNIPDKQASQSKASEELIRELLPQLKPLLS